MKDNKKYKNIFKAFFLVFCITLYYKCQAEGTCNLVQGADGSYTISCTGDGIVYRYENITNEFYIIENCEELKEQFLYYADDLTDTKQYLIDKCESSQTRGESAISDLRSALSTPVYDSNGGSVNINSLTGNGKTVSYSLNQLSLVVSDFEDMAWDLNYIDMVYDSELDDYVTFRSKVEAIKCGSCSTNSVSGGDCCDFSSILAELNKINIKLTSVSNHVENVSSRADDLISALSVKSVLGYYNETYGQSYFDFLTNHYLRVARGETVSDSEGGKNTNWFARVETLLAALVFGDGETTNTVDSSEGEALQDQLSTSFHQLTEGPQNEMAETLDEITPSVIEQVRRFSSSFNSASMPSEVVLFKGSGEDAMKISFHVSGDSVYYDLFRSITTLCWALVGLFVVYRFLVWSITKIVVLVQFCFNVFTDIFKSR